MRHSEDIVKRVRQLEKTLEWRPSPKGEDETILVSTDTTRVVARVQKIRDGQYGVYSWKYSQESASFVFFDPEGAKSFAKFNAIKD